MARYKGPTMANYYFATELEQLAETAEGEELELIKKHLDVHREVIAKGTKATEKLP